MLPLVPTDGGSAEDGPPDDIPEPPGQSLLQIVSRVAVEMEDERDAASQDPLPAAADRGGQAAPDVEVERTRSTAQDLLDQAKQQMDSLPSYCDSVTGVPYVSSLRARAFASLTRLHLRGQDLRTPSDPVEWACSHPWSSWFLYGLVFWAGMTMAAFIYASFWYRAKIPPFDQHSRLEPEATFESGHFGCMSDWSSCLCAFVFPAVRWADTMHMAGILSFWAAFWTLTLCELPAVLFGVFGLLFAAPLVFYRQQFREKLGVASGQETYITDCFYAFFCSCCLISQEARVMNEAYIVGHNMVPLSAGRPD
jgi:Cys-rich protein (TIGR01571 family)